MAGVAAGLAVLVAAGLVGGLWVRGDLGRLFSRGSSATLPAGGSPASAPASPAASFTNSLGMRFVRVEPGAFLMGSPNFEPGRDDDEARHRVTITRPFMLGVHEVTRGQFAAFVAATRYRTQAEKDGAAYVWKGTEHEYESGASWRQPGFDQTDDHPVVSVTWNDAVAFAQWLSHREGKTYRLPTEAEWEYACRAGTQAVYPWGDDPGLGGGWENAVDRAFKERFPDSKESFDWLDGHVFTAPVGSFRANGWGLHDMIGNASEWCADWYDGYPASDAADPKGPADSPTPGRPFRVVRGGSWGDGPRTCRAGERIQYGPPYAASYVGFRLCLDLE